MPLILSVCSDCEQNVRDAMLEAYRAGQASVLAEAKAASKYWHAELEKLMYPST